jgi:AraC-like DNA-binding protein
VLRSYELSRDTRFDAFRDSLNGVFYPAKVEPTGHDRFLEGSLLTAASLTHLTVGFVQFGTETQLDPGALGAYHVNVAVSGAVESWCGKQQVVARPGTAAVFTPREHTVLPRWGADAGQLCIKIERRALESELEAMLGHPVDSTVRFDVAFDLTSPAGRSWSSVVHMLLSELETEHSLARESLAHREQLERMIISSLLLAHRHDHVEELFADAPPARTRTVKRVVDALDDAPEQPWSLPEMAKLAEVSARRLQQGFAEQMGMSPTVYLKAVRLEKVRHDLMEGAGSVSDVAHRWGFSHLGRFAEAYRHRFSEAPSETLRRTGR